LTLILDPAAAHSPGGCNRWRAARRLAGGVELLIVCSAGAIDIAARKDISLLCRGSLSALVEKNAMN
jgi:hypothetical protein